MPKLITESVALNATKSGPGRIRIKIIDAGEGSSGTYPTETIKAAAKDKVFSAGTHMYADHPGAQESYDRPERTIKDLAAVLTSDAVYDAAEEALYAEAKVFPHWREAIAEMAEDIGVSIRASAQMDEKDGKRTITRLLHAESVDFVTKAGRGGKIAEVLESARRVIEATANDTREYLNAAVKDAGSGRYAWVRDFDDSIVWYATYGEDDAEHIYQQGYTLAGNTVTLTGDPVEVRIETRFVPVAPAAESAPADSPSNPAGVTENRKEPTVATTNIEESELSALRADASRAAALEAENRKLRESALKAEAAKIVAEAFDGIDAPRTITRLAESYTVKEDGTLDAEALKAEATESAAEWRAAHGEGTVRGVGDTTAVTESKTITDADILGALDGEAK
ncbi:hypothetical protein [Arthrobacter luteolus]|uniref:hypothetical protein n=1 Tax=Arthrobacter luteolus TaxID=98672 RepID=UPI00082BC84F|nr:hypothetical protein [Arthrobacter luteolus]